MSTRANPSALSLQRNSAIDAYRGFVMLLMMGEVLQFKQVAESFPNSVLWRVLSYNQTHVPWTGMSLHDMIQPSFTFLVGVALPYSLRSRQRKGESRRRMVFHTIWRSFLLIFLGIFLRSMDHPMVNFTFEDTLTQIGMGYTFAFLVTFLRPKWQWATFALILIAYWLAWAIYPAPGTTFNYAAVGVPADWHQHLLHGFASHWNKNSNLGQAFDIWFLNLFPRPTPFLFNAGGYLTLSFIPTIATMLLGLFAGRWLIESQPQIPFRKLITAAVLLTFSGALLHVSGICPIVKRIWTPAWVLWSGGICYLFLVAFSWIVDTKKNTRLAYPLVVVGMNSIAAYLMAHLFEGFIQSSLRIWLGMSLLNIFGTGLEPLTLGILTLAIYWYLLHWMFERKIFLRI